MPYVRNLRAGGRIRGMGDTQTVNFPFVFEDTGIIPTGLPNDLPCIPPGQMGPPAAGQVYCLGAQPPTSTPGTSSGVCFMPLFPWIGQKAGDGSCTPVIPVSDPWPLLATVGLGAMLVFKMFGRR